MSSRTGKPYQTFEAQVEILRSRGMEISDEQAALSCLRRIGYFRLSPYWHPFRVREELSEAASRFRPGCSFQHALALYVFDKRLRLLLLDAVERIEIAVRVEIADVLGRRDPLAHLVPDELHGTFVKQVGANGRTDFEAWKERFDKAVGTSKADFVKHYRERHEGEMPVWVAVELWDFGLLSRFLGGMKDADKRLIASRYEIPDPRIMESWVRSANIVRNLAAHHDRLWNRDLFYKPVLPKPAAMPEWDRYLASDAPRGRVYTVLCILIHFLRSISPNSSWPFRLRELVDDFPLETGLDLKSMGFPSDWDSHAFLPPSHRSARPPSPANRVDE